MRFKRCHCDKIYGWKDCQCVNCGGFIYSKRFIAGEFGTDYLESALAARALAEKAAQVGK